MFIDSVPTPPVNDITYEYVSEAGSNLITYGAYASNAFEEGASASTETDEEYARMLESRVVEIQNRLEGDMPTGLSATDNIAYVVKLLAISDAEGLFNNIFARRRTNKFVHSFLTGSLNDDSGLGETFYRDLYSFAGLMYKFFGELDHFRSVGRVGFRSLIAGVDGTLRDKIVTHGNTILRMVRNSLPRNYRSGHLKNASFLRVLTYVMTVKENEEKAGSTEVAELVRGLIDYVVMQADTDDLDKTFLSTMMLSTINNV